jgi:cysteinyl-tRNA synthetase
MATNKDLLIYNSLQRKKELFEPLKSPLVGLYVCGPTVYGDAHLGHARPAITFDLVFRYLTHLGYKVRYVRNITDVGHLENDADEGEDKIAKKARLEQLEPMEVAQHYSDNYHRNMDDLNTKKPSIEPRATGHIIEQIELIKKIFENGFAYEVNGSVYFDVLKYNASNNYGKLSGRIVEDLIANTRELDGQEEKRNSLDFALWKKAQPEHIMKWPSPWGIGFPGWHIECSAMSSKYLGEHFDIHGGGMDLLFPHHECEVAQSKAGHNCDPAKYWMHNNMITINGQKMGKSLGNFITLDELFSGKHPLLEEAYSPMTIRFFILQAHYRSTLDFSNDALKAARKGYRKIINGLLLLEQLKYETSDNNFDELEDKKVNEYIDDCFKGMNDDFNSAISIANLFNLLKYINTFANQIKPISILKEETFLRMKETYQLFVNDILALKIERQANEIFEQEALNIIIGFYRKAKEEKDFAAVDNIRAKLKGLGILLKDSKNGVAWAYEE